MTATLTIFDCDGVLVDTEGPANRLLVQVLAEAGLEIGVEACMARFVGKSMTSVQQEVEAEIGRALPRDWPERVRDRTIDVLTREGVAAIPGVRAVVEQHVALGRPYCVASSGRIDKMHATLGGAGLLPLMEHALFSATMGRHGKPAPDLFLHAAKTMGHAPGQCVVIEDSPAGIQAAKAAGMRVCAYANAPYADAERYRALGAEVFTDMGELPGMIGLG